MAKNPALRLPFPGEHARSLVECMVECADDIRQLHTDFGGRSYSVSLVWLRWSADENGDGFVRGEEEYIDDNTVGAGRATVVADIPLLPIPAVSSFAGLRRDLDPTGNTERGAITISQISMGYSEDILRGLLPELVDPERPGELIDGIQFFYEIREVREAGLPNQGTAQCELGQLPTPIRRKYVLDSVPDRDTYGFQWTVTVTRADGERHRDGSTENIL